MNRYYLLIGLKTTEVLKRDKKGNCSKVLFNGAGYINNTFEYAFDKGIALAIHDKSHLKNKFSAFGASSHICGVEYNENVKISIFLLALFEDYIKDFSSEVVVIYKEDFDEFFSEKQYDWNKSFKFMFEAVNKELNCRNIQSNLKFKGALSYYLLVSNLMIYADSKYEKGISYVDDFIISSSKFINKIHRYLFGVWNHQTKEGNAINEEFYKYLKLEGILHDDDDFNNIKDFIIEQGRRNPNLKNLILVRKDEEYILDCKKVNNFYNQELDNHINEMISKIDEFKLYEGYSMIVDIHDDALKNRVIRNLIARNFNIMPNETVEVLKNKICKYADMVIFYNTALYRKRVQQIQKKYRMNDFEVGHEFLFYQGIAYRFYKYLNKKEHQAVYKSLEYEYVEEKMKYLV